MGAQLTGLQAEDLFCPDDQEDHEGDGAHRGFAHPEGDGARQGVLPLRARRDAGRLGRRDALERRPPAHHASAETIRRSAVVIFSSDRGLAGAFNSQILREGLELAELLRCAGQGAGVLPRRSQGRRLLPVPSLAAAAEWIGDTDTPHVPRRRRRSAQTLLEDFYRAAATTGGVDEIHLVYNRFVSMMTQSPEIGSPASARGRRSR